MKYILLLISLIFTTAHIAEPFTLYLIRHAEKDLTIKQDPALTEEGKQTAQKLMHYMKGKPITRLYSSDYKRTRETAEPVARHQQLAIELYDPTQLAQFAVQLLERQQNALIVGHSNTTPELIALVGGKADPIPDDQYGDIYIVRIAEGGKEITTNVEKL